MAAEIPVAPESQRLPSAGQVLAGKYRVEETLGVGGMGAVIAATALETGQRVAIKIMLPHLVRQPEFAARFLREAQAMAALKTEHVARVLDVGRFYNGEPYLVMELLEGEDLDKLGRQKGPLPIAEAVGYVLEACSAIAEAHSIGIIHRDLKPGNLFLARPPGPPVIKVLDFGISKPTKLGPGEADTRALTGTDTTLGSPQYMSPEQFRSSKKVDVRTDIWSLGMILHRLLTGRVAFEADSVGELLTMLVTEPPTPLRKRRPDAPAELEAIILRCLEKDPVHRVQNVGQLVRLLMPFCPATGRIILPQVAALLGEEAVSRRLPAPSSVPPPPPPSTPSVSSPSVDSPTQSNWAPTGPVRAPKNRLRVGLSLCVIVAGILGAGLGARRLLQEAPALEVTPAKGPTPASTAASSPALASAPAPASAAVNNATGAAGSDPTVALQLALAPRDASVEIDGAPATGNPIRLPKDGRTHVLVASAPGYLPESREITSQSDAKLRIALKRQAGARLAPHGPRSSSASSPSVAAEPTGRKPKGPMETDL